METLLTTKDVMARMKIGSPALIYKWVRQRRLAVVREGQKMLRFREADVEAFIKTLTREAA